MIQAIKRVFTKSKHPDAFDFMEFRSHDFRKTRLKQMHVEEKQKTTTIMKYAGHKRYDTTLKYIGADDEEMLNDVLDAKKNK